jgi:hypothetical protein
MLAIQIIGGVRDVNCIRENFDPDAFLPLTGSRGRVIGTALLSRLAAIFRRYHGYIDGDRRSSSRGRAAFARHCQRCCSDTSACTELQSM